MSAILQIIDGVMVRKWAFLGVFFLVFSFSYGLLFAFDWLPEPIETTAVGETTSVKVIETASQLAATHVTNVEQLPEVGPAISAADTDTAGTHDTTGDVLPQTLTIDTLGRTVPVLNPASRTVSALDAALLKGVVRHPDSATLGQEGNLFILGHSSYLPVVTNKNFQALNGIQNLKWGDTLRLTSADTQYMYRVEKVYKAKASALTIPVRGEGKHLTLATCNSFGSTDDRYIVEASLVSTKPL
jgi:LPXTG-site transpeptidase (sortase) family protein